MSSSSSSAPRRTDPKLSPSIDPDVPFEPGDRPSHHQWRRIGLVFVGGCVGTLLRYAVAEAIPKPAGVPVAVVAVNLVGAFTLGLVLEALSRRGPDAGRRRAVRLLVGTGILGGFTTYSALAVDTDTLLEAGRVGMALAYAGSTLVLGLVAAAAGLTLGARATSHGARPDSRGSHEEGPQ